MNNVKTSRDGTTADIKRKYVHLRPAGRKAGAVVTMLCGKRMETKRARNLGKHAGNKRTCPECLLIKAVEGHLRAVEKQLLGGD